MTATISGWAPDPHDADAPEDDDVCEGCGIETEDLWECDLTHDEASELKLRPMPGTNWLCLSCMAHVERMREDGE